MVEVEGTKEGDAANGFVTGELASTNDMPPKKSKLYFICLLVYLVYCIYDLFIFYAIVSNLPRT